jgi:thymidylate synthase
VYKSKYDIIFVCTQDLTFAQTVIDTKWVTHVYYLIKPDSVHFEGYDKIEKPLSVRYVKKCLPFELQYHNLLRSILSAPVKMGRNGNTRSISGAYIQVDLRDGFPILTGRKVFWRGIVEELIWFLQGRTDAKWLQDRNIHIWDKNTTREFLDARGLNYPEGEIGPGYGYQIRFAGGNYPEQVGVDQLMNVIKTLKTNPNDRRMLINLWSVPDIDKMALPPCHLLYQFTVSEGLLHGHLYQRSQDIVLGWNTSTLALLTHIISQETNIPVGTISHTMADVHIYEAHIEGIQEYLNRCPYKSPHLIINNWTGIDKMESQQFKLDKYHFHDAIKMEMVA